MIKWMRPSGKPITTNEKSATVEYAESLGWTREDASQPKEVIIKAKPTKAKKQTKSA